VLAQFLPNDPVIVECGAYKGRDTTKLAQGFPLARIYAFEPLRTAFFELSEIMKAYPGVSLFNQALDKTSGDKKFYICHGTYGQNPIFEFHSSLLKPTKSSRVHLMGPFETVPCVSLFNFCKDNRIDKIDMLWLSAEGNELQILEGAQALLWKVSLVYARSQLHSTRKSITLFDDLKRFMEKNNFILLSHFYFPNIHGDALFIRRDLFAK
jgi:FkbM family methyltransferase